MKGDELMRVLGLAFLASSLSSCAIPVPGGGAFTEVPEKAMAAIKVGASTRADVLLMLADPATRGENDVHFVYSWAESYGGAILAFPYPIAAAGAAGCHALVLRFAPNGTVAKLRVFHGRILKSVETIFSDPLSGNACTRDTAFLAQIDQWLAEPMPPD